MRTNIKLTVLFSIILLCAVLLLTTNNLLGAGTNAQVSTISSVPAPGPQNVKPDWGPLPVLPPVVPLGSGATFTNVTDSLSVDGKTQNNHIALGSIIRHRSDAITEVFDSQASLTFETRDAEDKLIFTPEGPIPATHTALVPNRSLIYTKGNTTRVYLGSVLVLTVINGDNPMVDTPPPATPEAQNTLGNGWIEDARDTTGRSVDYFDANWYVPLSPISANGSAINYIFNALQTHQNSPQRYGGILQPVLAWNVAQNQWAGYPIYGVENQYYWPIGNCPVSPGDQVEGKIVYSGDNQWQIWFLDNTNSSGYEVLTMVNDYGPTGYSNSGLDSFLTIEGYYVYANSDVSGGIHFTSASLSYLSNPISPTWQPHYWWQEQYNPFPYLTNFSVDTTSLRLNTCIRGDANEDGVVNMGDVTEVERIILGLDSPTREADANEDGVINMGDVVTIERIILGENAIAGTPPDANTATNAATVNIVTPSQTPPGSDLTVNVDVRQVTRLAADSFDVIFDPNILRLDSITNGNVGTTVIPVDGYNKRNEGIYTVVQNLSGLSSATGSGTLATLHFQVIGTSGQTSSITLANGCLFNDVGNQTAAQWLGSAVTVVAH